MIRNNNLALATVIAMLVNLVGAGLGPPMAAAAPVPERSDVETGASLGALPAWFDAHVETYTYSDHAGRYRFEGLPHGTHKVTLDPATLQPGLRPPDGEPAPVLWLTPGQAQTSGALSTGVRFTAAYNRESGNIGGVVFVDLDGDGQQGPNEPGIFGVRMVDPTLHQYFVPFDDIDLWELFVGKNQCHASPPTPVQPLISYVYLTSGSDGTVYYYDHWEDGYDADPLNPDPTSSTEIGVLDAGGTQLFHSDIDPALVGMGPPFYYDGRDRISIWGGDATVERMTHPNRVDGTDGVISAAAWEVLEAADWGSEYVASLGEDLDFNGADVDDHDFTGLEVMAWQPGTEVYYNGTLVATLNAGEVYFVDGANDGPGGEGVDSDDVITATAPIQVQMMTGSCDGRPVSAHGYTLQPMNVWDNAYWTPVPGFASSAYCSFDAGYADVDTDIYVHNPHPSPITVTVSSDLGTANIVIPPNTTISVLDETGWADISTGSSGVYLSSSDTFWGVGVVDSSTNGATDAQVFDWAYSLIPESELSSRVVVGYAPGNDAGPPPTDNSSLAFVTAITDTVVYVDLNQDGLSDPIDMNSDGDRDDYDAWGVTEWDEPLSALGIPLQAGQVLRVGDPFDHDLMGARIYTLELDEKIAVAWGQDPCRALAAAPSLDLGYTVLPIPIPRLSKVDDLAIDADLTEGSSPGDTLTYTLVLHNNGMGSMNSVVLTDTPPYTYTDFVVGSLQVTTPPPTGTIEYSSDGISFADPENPDIQALRITWPTIGPQETVTITFRVYIRSDIPVTITEITNQAIVDSDNTDPRDSEDPDDPSDPDTDTPVARPLLSIDKVVTPTVASPGGLLTYTVVVANYGGGTALLTQISDTLPAWLTYVPGTLDLTWPVAQVEVTTQTTTSTTYFHGYYADDYGLSATQSTTYTGNDGSLSWSTDWTEVNDDGDPDGGEVQVRTDGNALSEPGYLWMEDTDGDDAGVERALDLSLFVAPWLRYYVSGTTSMDGDDSYRVEADGIVVAEEYNGDYTVREIDLSAAAGNPAVALGFLATGGMDAGEYYRFDHISIYETDPQRVVPDTLTWETTVLSYITSIGGDPVSYDPVNGQMVITQGLRLPPGGGITVTFQADLADASLPHGLMLTNTACVTAANWLEILSPPCADTPVQIESSHVLTTTKTADPSPVEAGSLLTYAIHYTVTGDEAVESMLISDTTPVSTTFWSAVPPPFSDPGVGNTGPVIWWPLSGLWPPGSGIIQTSGTVTMVVLVDSALVSGTEIFNSVFISDTTGITDTNEITTQVQTSADVWVTKEDSHDPVTPGENLTYALTVGNEGPSDAENVVVSDTLPLEVRFVSTDPLQDAGPNPLVWNLGTLTPGETRLLTVVVTVNSWVTQTFTNTVVVTTTTPDTNPDNNDDDEPTTPLLPGLELVKTVEPGEVVRNMPFTYTIIITNTGSVTFDPLVLTDTLPPDFYYVVGFGQPTDPDVIAEPLLVWQNLGPLAPGVSIAVTFQVTATPGVTGTFVNVALVSGEYPGGVITDTDDVPIDIVVPAVVVDKQVAAVDLDDVPPNYVTFTIAINNVGPSTIDVLPLLDQYDPYYLSFTDATPYPEEDADDGLVIWHDLTAPPPHGFNRNLPPGASFPITTVFRVVHDITETVNTAIVTGALDIYGNPVNEDDDDEVINDVPTPVELLYFRAVVEQAAVRLEWATAAEVDNVGFYLYRAPDDNFAHAQVMTFVAATGSGSTYSHVDRKVTEDQIYRYWLADVSTDGTETLHGPVWGGVRADALPHRLYLSLVQRGWEEE